MDETDSSSPAHLAPRALIAIGGSAGAHAALARLVRDLPGDLDAAIVVALHRSEDGPSRLDAILDPLSLFSAREAVDGAPLERGTLTVAPPGRHLLVERGRCRVVRGPRENRQRPAIDPLFRSAAHHYGPAAIGVLLSGLLSDGVAGLWTIRTCGGVTVVQDPADAAFGALPEAALEVFDVDHRVAAGDLAPLLVVLVAAARVAPAASASPALAAELALSMGEPFESAAIHLSRIGELTLFTCPACQGALWEIDDGGALRFRCHTGHAYSIAALAGAQEDAVERALYEAQRALHEQAAVARRIAERAHAARQPRTAALFEERERTALDSAARLRHLLPPRDR